MGRMKEHVIEATENTKGELACALAWSEAEAARFEMALSGVRKEIQDLWTNVYYADTVETRAEIGRRLNELNNRIHKVGLGCEWNQTNG